MLTSVSLTPAIEIVGKKAGLPPLPPCDFARYYRKNLAIPAVQKLADFIADQVALLEGESRPTAEPLPRKGTKSSALAPAY